MDTTHIMEFLALAKTCNFQETAFEMHTSQSTLSKHVKMLENELGNKLFNRTTRTVELNEYGKLFYEFALQFKQLNNEFYSAMHLLNLSDHGKLSIAYSPSLGPYQVIETLSDFTTMHPEITVNLIEDRNPTELLFSHSCNLAFNIPIPMTDGKIEKIPYKKDRLVVVLPADHPLAKEPMLTIPQIIDEPFVSYADNLGEFRSFLAECQKLDFMPRIAARTIFCSNTLKMISQGVGISVMNLAQMNYTSHENLVAIDLSPRKDLEICVLRLKDHKKTASESSFLKYIQSLESDAE